MSQVQGGLDDVVTFLNSRTFEFEQLEGSEDMHDKFRSSLWLRKYVFWPIAQIVEKEYSARIIVEMKIIHALRTKGKAGKARDRFDEEQRQALLPALNTSNYSIPPIEGVAAKIFGIPSTSYPTISKTGFGGNTILARFRFVAHIVFLLDICDTIRRIGFDPILPEACSRGTKNQCLQHYMR